MSAYAIIETGGKQYRVEPGKSIVVEKLNADEGSTVELERVLLVSDDAVTTVGNPLVDGAKVLAEVESQAKGDKLIVFKYKPKVRYSVKTGHRQQLTKLSIKQILTDGQKPVASKKAAATRKAPTTRKPATPRTRRKAEDGA